MLLKNRNMRKDFSYRHLYCFWVVAKEGGMTRAADRLGTAVQTVSTQVRELERSLGYALLKTFGAAGMGVFPAAELVQEEVTGRYQVRRVGPCAGVEEHFYALAAHKKLRHPLVQKLLAAARLRHA